MIQAANILKKDSKLYSFSGILPNTNVREMFYKIPHLDIYKMYLNMAYNKYSCYQGTTNYFQNSTDCSYLSGNTVGNYLHVDDQLFLPEMAAWARDMRGSMAPYDILITLTS